MSDDSAPETMVSPGELAEQQADVLGLEELVLRRLVDGAPDVHQVVMGGGAQPEFTLIGETHEKYAAAAILNYSTADITVGFSAGAALVSPYVVKARTMLVVPQKFVDLSVAVTNAIAAGPALTPIVVVRLFVAPLTPFVASLSSYARADPNWTVFAGVLVNATASASRPGIPGVTHICTAILATLSVVTAGGPTQTDVVLRDGASAAGNIIWRGQLSVTNVIGAIDRIALTGLSIPGSAGNAMTLEFGGGGGIGIGEQVVLSGYDQ